MTATLQHRGPDHGATYRSTDGSARARIPAAEHHRSAHRRQSADRQRGRHRCSSSSTARSTTTASCGRGLVANGHVFRSNADSEVIVHLFEERGDQAIDALDGMFALGDLGRAARHAHAGARSRRQEAAVRLPGRRRASRSRRRSRRSSRIPISTIEHRRDARCRTTSCTATCRTRRRSIATSRTSSRAPSRRSIATAAAPTGSTGS